MKYSLGKYLPSGFSSGSGYISPYILTQVMVQTFSMSKKDTFSIVLPGWAILVELIFCTALAAGPIFSSICPAQLGQYSIHPAELSEYWKILPS